MKIITKFLFAIAAILLAVQAYSQANYNGRYYESLNQADTNAIRAIATASVSELGNNTTTGFIYYNPISKKWRAWQNGGWVDMIPAASGTVTASNGLTKTGNNITLGGSLTANTTISGGNTRAFTLNGITTYTVIGQTLGLSTTNGAAALSLNGASNIALTADNIPLSIVTLNGSTLALQSSGALTGNGNTISLTSQTGDITIAATTGTGGAVLLANDGTTPSNSYAIDDTGTFMTSNALQWDFAGDATIQASTPTAINITTSGTMTLGGGSGNVNLTTNGAANLKGNGFVIGTTTSGSKSFDFPSTASLAESTTTVTVTGAVTGEGCVVGNTIATNGIFTATVTAANTATIKFSNTTSAAVDPSNQTFKVTCFK